MKKSGVVIVAAGRGERLKSDIPKAFIQLLGKPLYKYSLEVFLNHPDIDEVVLVVPSEKVGGVPKNRCQVVGGGATRQESVINGLAALSPKCESVLVHDAARPFVTDALIDRLLATLAEGKSGIVAWPVPDTLKRAKGDIILETVDRSHFWAAQTPQAFPVAILKEALQKAKEENFVGTDEASVVERLGLEVCLVLGDARNIKITTQYDLTLAQALLKYFNI